RWRRSSASRATRTRSDSSARFPTSSSSASVCPRFRGRRRTRRLRRRAAASTRAARSPGTTAPAVSSRCSRSAAGARPPASTTRTAPRTRGASRCWPVPEPLLEVRGLAMHFPLRRSAAARVRRDPPELLRAVDGVDLEVARGETLGLVGESGCGKSTLGRCLVGLYEPTAGELRFAGRPLGTKRERAERRRIQMVFQDPYSSLNPRMTVRQTLAELLRAHRMVPKESIDARCRELLDLVGLGPRALDAYPRQFSGGQRQRISIARALALEPELLIADEPVSALDVSVQATVLNLLAELREKLGLAMLLIAHNLA